MAAAAAAVTSISTDRDKPCKKWFEEIRKTTIEENDKVPIWSLTGEVGIPDIQTGFENNGWILKSTANDEIGSIKY